jgi:transposase
MVWGAITGSSKSYLVLIPPNRCTAKDFVEIVSQGALEHCYWHHDHYEHLILMEDGAPRYGSNIQKDWREQLGLKKLEWPPNSPNLNPIEHVWKQASQRSSATEKKTTKQRRNVDINQYGLRGYTSRKHQEVDFNNANPDESCNSSSRW